MDEFDFCTAEDMTYCALIGPARVAPHHHCQFDDGHGGIHECACGHRWTEPDDA